MFDKKGSQKFTEGSLLKLLYVSNVTCLTAFHQVFNFLEKKICQKDQFCFDHLKWQD